MVRQDSSQQTQKQTVPDFTLSRQENWCGEPWGICNTPLTLRVKLMVRITTLVEGDAGVITSGEELMYSHRYRGLLLLLHQGGTITAWWGAITPAKTPAQQGIGEHQGRHLRAQECGVLSPAGEEMGEICKASYNSGYHTLRRRRGWGRWLG